MKTPICDLCGKTGILCSNCRKAISESRITEADFQVAKALYQINEGRNISDASFERAIDAGRLVLVFTKGEPGLLIGKDGAVVSELSKSLGKKVRVAQVSQDPKKTISDIILPVRLLGINSVYSRGKEYSRVRLQKSHLSMLPMDLTSLESILKSLLKNEVKISLE